MHTLFILNDLVLLIDVAFYQPSLIVVTSSLTNVYLFRLVLPQLVCETTYHLLLHPTDRREQRQLSGLKDLLSARWLHLAGDQIPVSARLCTKKHFDALMDKLHVHLD